MAESPIRRARSHGSPAVRKSGEASGAAAAAAQKVRITVDLPKPVHTALKLRTAKDNTDGQTFVRALLEEALAAELKQLRQ